MNIPFQIFGELNIKYGTVDKCMVGDCARIAAGHEIGLKQSYVDTLLYRMGRGKNEDGLYAYEGKYAGEKQKKHMFFVEPTGAVRDEKGAVVCNIGVGNEKH